MQIFGTEKQIRIISIGHNVIIGLPVDYRAILLRRTVDLELYSERLTPGDRPVTTEL